MNLFNFAVLLIGFSCRNVEHETSCNLKSMETQRRPKNYVLADTEPNHLQFVVQSHNPTFNVDLKIQLIFFTYFVLSIIYHIRYI